MVESGLVSDLANLFEMSFNQLESLPFGDGVFGETRATKLYWNIVAAKEQPLNRIITALGIRKTGRTFGRRLAAHFHSLDALLEAMPEDLQ